MPKKEPIYTEIEGQRVKLTNLEKVLYPFQAYTKAEIIQYTLEIAPLILPFVKGRPLTLIRFPDGIDNKTFYTKNKPSWTPDWIPTTYVPWDEDNEYILAMATPHLIWLANLAALEVHIMNSTINDFQYPDFFVIDLDPPDDQDFISVKEIAFALKTFLEGYGYTPYAKLSGGKGIHLFIPILPKWEHEVVTDSIKALMKIFVKANPSTTLSTSKTKRVEKILLDVYRNHAGNTVVMPFGLRGKEGAPISMPVTWEHLASVHSAQAYTLANYKTYLATHKNLWKGFWEKATKLYDQELPKGLVVPLNEYAAKRDFEKTDEPADTEEAIDISNRFVIHLHHATRLHYDLRLGMNKVLKSWAIPKGLPLVQGVKRLAIQTEDHPAKYIDFEGTIPKEEYGGGQMWVFDTGKIEWIQKWKTKYKFRLIGKSIDAVFSLYRMKNKEWMIQRSETAKNLLVYKHKFQPMLCEALQKLPAKQEGYEYEIKWDGIRVIYYKNGDDIQLISRSGRDILAQFPEFQEGKFIRVQRAILDCEIVCLDDSGRPVFSDVISRMHRAGKTSIVNASKVKPAYLYAFDCLYLDGKKLISQPLTKRKKWLRAIFKKGNTTRISDTFENGKQIYEAAKSMGLEGIMAKQKDSPYSPGNRSPFWKKIKFTRSFECHIIGYTKGKGDRADIFGALHLGNPEDGRWKYHGKVGTGFDQKMMKEIWQQLLQLDTISKPITALIEQETRTTWVMPQYLCEVTYASFSSNDTLREPVFLKMWRKD